MRDELKGERQQKVSLLGLAKRDDARHSTEDGVRLREANRLVTQLRCEMNKAKQELKQTKLASIQRGESLDANEF